MLGNVFITSAAGESSPTHSSVPSDTMKPVAESRVKCFLHFNSGRPIGITRKAVAGHCSGPTYSSENSGKHFSDLIADLVVRSSGVSDYIISHIELFVQWHLQFFSPAQFLLIPAPRPPNRSEEHTSELQSQSN